MPHAIIDLMHNRSNYRNRKYQISTCFISLVFIEIR